MNAYFEKALGPRNAARVNQVLADFDPTLHRLKLPESREPFTLLGVYRRRNAAHMAELMEQAPSSLLWGLDGIHPAMKAATLGEGPGSRFALLNRLVEQCTTNSHCVVADDDVQLINCSLSALIGFAARHHLDLCQPAHVFRSPNGHPIVRRRPLSAARLTNFVEIGPLFVIGPRFRSRILPFPTDSAMGWGAELDWLDLHEQHGARLAVVDAVAMKHLGTAGAEYDTAAEQSRTQEALQARGAASWADLVRTIEIIRPWAD